MWWRSTERSILRAYKQLEVARRDGDYNKIVELVIKLDTLLDALDAQKRRAHEQEVWDNGWKATP